MGKGYNDKGDGCVEKQEFQPSREFPSTRGDKAPKQQSESTMADEKRDEKRDEKVIENCATWSNNLLKSARISKITQEYRENKEYKPPGSCSVSEKMTEKNRYRHIFCADENRVVLKDRDSSNDYIHASWMEMPDQVQFISTQGPIKNTLVDFWHMIYTEKCPVIVMLCQFIEDDTEKCQKYFSDTVDKEKEYGEYRVKVIEKTTELFNPVKYTVIQVEKRNSSTKHVVHHYWYHDWHDQVAPLDPTPMVKMYKAVLKKANNKPIVVHCSAGVGRTATFVGIHLGSCMIRENSSVEMMDIMKKLRKMRLGSIQSQLQYVFLITCIIELFIDEKFIKRDSLFESLLKKYSDVTKKVTAAIVREEAYKKRKLKEQEDKEREEEKREEKRDKEREEKREKEREEKREKEKRESEAMSKDRRDSDTQSKPKKDQTGRNLKKADEGKEMVGKFPRRDGTMRDGRKEERSLDERVREDKKKDASISPSMYRKQTASVKERSRHQNAKKTTRTQRKKQKTKMIGFK